MNRLIDAAFSRSRTVLLVGLFLFVSGLYAYSDIPRESSPDVPIPIIYVLMAHEGISPEDAARLLVRPMEKELQSIEGLEEMTATAAEGYASIMLEFDAGFDADQALLDVREKVDIARAELPAETEEPIVQQINIALFPVVTAVLAGPVPERTLVDMARQLQDRIEALPGVLEVDIGGDREEVLEVIVDPTVMETYQVSYTDVLNMLSRNNRLVAAGALDSGSGRFLVKVPGVIEEVEDVRALPIKVADDTVVTFAEVATLRRTFKDPDGFARVGGQSAISLEVSKRPGANIIGTIEQVRAVIGAASRSWPDAVNVAYLQDQSEDIRNMLGELQNNVISAIVLVMVMIVASLGLRSSILVGLAIPGSFLAGILVLYALGMTLNIVVLFSLILVSGMLVDSAIVITELADRKMAEGLARREAYRFASKRMAWPVISSTATTLAVFLPLLVWPGTVGEFMKYLPITVIACLGASLAMALIFVPVLGGLVGKAGAESERALHGLRAAEAGDLRTIGGFTGWYLSLLRGVLKRPAWVLAASLFSLVGAYVAYGTFGNGVEFFPDVEPRYAQVEVRARGNLSVWDKDALVREVENRILGMDSIKTVYTRTLGGGEDRREIGEDVIGVIQIELVDWQQRPPAEKILAEIRRRTSNIGGILIETLEQESGPSSGKPIEIQLSARDPEVLQAATEQVRAIMADLGGFEDIEDSRALPGIEWRLKVDRELAARYGADVTLLGHAVQMVTNGIKVAEYRPDDTDEEVDIRVRFPVEARTLGQLRRLRVPTEEGMVPVANFVEFEPAQKTGTITRVDARRAITIEAEAARGFLVAERVDALQARLDDASLPQGVQVDFAGEEEDQQEAATFLTNAFVVALFLMALMMVTQFNSLYQAVLVLSAIVFSTAGVLLGLLISGEPFGIVMCGVGVIALAGIVVNNNIILIDTYNELRGRGLDAVEAALRTGAQRLRPVYLTAGTTVLGLIPMMLGLNLDLVHREFAVGAPSTQFWTQLATAIAGGLTFATVLTLLLTPAMLVLGHRVGAKLRQKFNYN